MQCLARFQKINGQLLRFDTRIYLESFIEHEDSVCIGAIVGKNPGSALPKKLDCLFPLELNGDRMLPCVGNRFKEGYKLADKKIPANAYVRVWNLFYICNNNLRSALAGAFDLNPLPICSSEMDCVPLIWFGWGGNDIKLNSFKYRFINRKYSSTFFYNHLTKTLINGVPSITECAKHTQGMPAFPIVEHLARVL